MKENITFKIVQRGLGHMITLERTNDFYDCSLEIITREDRGFTDGGSTTSRRYWFDGGEIKMEFNSRSWGEGERWGDSYTAYAHELDGDGYPIWQEYPRDFVEFTYEIHASEYGGYTVKKIDWKGYPSHSVLAGQPIIKYHESFDTLEEAQAAYPDAQVCNSYTGAKNTFDHLPDEPDY